MAILSFWKRKNLQSTKSGEKGGYGMTVFCF